MYEFLGDKRGQRQRGTEKETGTGTGTGTDKDRDIYTELKLLASNLIKHLWQQPICDVFIKLSQALLA